MRRRDLLVGGAIALVCSPAWAQQTSVGAPSNVTLGSGSPTNTNAAAGNVWCQTDLPTCWVTSGPFNVPTFVQSASLSNTFAIVLGTLPVTNDYLIGECANNSATIPTVNTGAGWALITGSNRTFTSGPANASIVLAEKKVSGDTTTVTPCTGGGGQQAASVMEVSNLNTTSFNNNFENLTETFNYRAGASITHVTTHGNDLAVAFGFVGGSSGAALSGGVTQTSGSAGGNNSVAGWGAVGGIGSNAQVTITGSGSGAWMGGGVLLTLNPSVGRGTGWAQASLSFDSAAHRQMTGANPVVSACGTETIDANATDSSGTVNITAGTPGSCTITFSQAYTTTDHCTVTQEPGNITSFAYSYTLSAITITGTTMAGKLDYRCDGF